MTPQDENEHIDFLVKESQRGNTQAFGELYDLFFPKIHKYVFFKVNKEEVEDVTASIFIKTWTKIKSYHKTECTFNSWVFRIAHNTVVDHYRTHKAVYTLDETLELEDEKVGPDLFAEKSLNSVRVHRALRKLGDKYQQVILYRFIHEMSNADVAEIMKTKEVTVRSLQFRALKQLRTILEDEDVRAHRRIVEAEERKQPKKVGFFSRVFARD